jgi:uncharacterized protein YecE (DUF72 family)
MGLMAAGAVRIGTSGWLYPVWRCAFYPKGLPHRQELAYLSRRMATVEINGSFYALLRPERYLAWYEQTPTDFVFAVKGSRFITHMKRLRDVEVPLANFFASGVLALGRKLGPFLWQLPPTLAFDPARLHSFFDMLPTSTVEAARIARRHDHRVAGRALTETDVDRPLRHAVEVRHPSYLDRKFPKLLRQHDISLVIADTAGKWPDLREVTSDLVYVRLHGAEELYTSGYRPEELDAWADRIRSWRRRHDVFVYFDNDVEVKAPYDAMALSARLTASTIE